MLGLKVAKEYDELGRLVKETHSDGYCEEISYAPDGRIVVIDTKYPNGEHEVENYGKVG